MRKLVPLRELEGLDAVYIPEECFPCKVSYRATDAVMALVETGHPDYENGLRVTGLCGNHAELVDVEDTPMQVKG
jgi:hypothetical protein